jgi:hypothetical protein
MMLDPNNVRKQDVSVVLFGRTTRNQDPGFAGLDPAEILDSLRATRDSMTDDFVDDAETIPRALLPGPRDRLLAVSQEDGFLNFAIDPNPVDRRSSHACTGLSDQTAGILSRRSSSRRDPALRDGHAIARGLMSLEAGHRSEGEESEETGDPERNDDEDSNDDQDE